MPYWQLYYHLVWATKRRQPLLTPAVEPIVYRYLREKSAEFDATIFALNGVADHVHLVVSLPPKHAVATYVGQIKGYASHMVNQRPDAPFRFRWQTEYAAFSFDRKRLPNFCAYVNRQKEHHRDDGVIPILERTDPLPTTVRDEPPVYAVETESAIWRQELLDLGH